MVSIIPRLTALVSNISAVRPNGALQQNLTEPPTEAISIHISKHSFLSSMEQVIDTKLLGKGVKEFSGQERDWPDWCWKFENYCGAISADLLQDMEYAKQLEDKITLSQLSAERKQRAANLAYILSNLVTGEMVKSFRKVERGNGFEMCTHYLIICYRNLSW